MSTTAATRMHARMRAATALLALLLLGALLGVACDGDDADGELREITFMAGFRPQATLPFTAVYVAAAKGYFADEGLDVTIRHSTQGEHLQLLLAGDVHFTTGTAAQLMRRRAAETPVRSVALFGQRGDQGFVAHADSGIDSPADFAGRSVGFKGGVVPAELLALLASAGLEADDVDLIGVPLRRARLHRGRRRRLSRLPQQRAQSHPQYRPRDQRLRSDRVRRLHARAEPPRARAHHRGRPGARAGVRARRDARRELRRRERGRGDRDRAHPRRGRRRRGTSASCWRRTCATRSAPTGWAAPRSTSGRPCKRCCSRSTPPSRARSMCPRCSTAPSWTAIYNDDGTLR